MDFYVGRYFYATRLLEDLIFSHSMAAGPAKLLSSSPPKSRIIETIISI